jgi:hypothetical protein
MCFSANASFSASAVLAVIGTASVFSATSAPSRLFAATPLLFAAQQGLEGLVWMTVADAPLGLPHQLAVNGFLTVALIVWPMWLPLSLESIEADAGRRRWLRALKYFGICVSTVSAVLLIRARPETTIVGHSLHYEFAGTQNKILSSLMLISYVIPTILPLWVSTTKFARQIGIMLVLSIVAATWVQREALTSVWCFFSSLLSGTILISVRESRQRMSHA